MFLTHFRLKQRILTIAIVTVVILIALSSLIASQKMASAHLLKSGVSNGMEVTTYHNDNARTGQNLNETVLRTNNVNARQFGKRVSYPVDGKISAQPLYLSNISVHGNSYNVVYVVTANDSVYAFDADAKKTAAPLWKSTFIHPPAVIPVHSSDIYGGNPQKNLGDPIGITGTPVIDPSIGALYVVAMTKENGRFFHRLHVLDVATGTEKAGSPLVIQASVAGHGDDNVKGVVSFNAIKENQRAALLLLNHIVYICWASFGDRMPYHGWVLGYEYTGGRLQQVHEGVYNDTPDSDEGGIWMSGAGPSADANGNLYVITGNGHFNLNKGGVDAGDSFLKLSTKNGLHLTDYFTPFNQLCMDRQDIDLGSGNPLLIPDQVGSAHPHLLISMGKEGRMYVIDRDNMGHYTSDVHLDCQQHGTAEEKRTDVDHIVQELPAGIAGKLFGSMGYWKGPASSGQMVYIGGFRDHLKAFQLKNGKLSKQAISQTTESFFYPGVTPSVSSNGNVEGTGIVWVNSSANCTITGCTPTGPGTLRAYDATNLGHELYNSGQNSVRDRLDSYVKFSVPTVIDGKVFVGTQTSLTIYGLL